MGVVFAAVHRATGADVAIKLVRPSTDRARIALENEILAMAGLNHPSLLYLYDFGIAADGATHWLVVERASGGSLEDWRPSSWEELAPVLEAICAGLAHAHARGMVHRDLKPANLLRATARDHRPGLKIADFGLAVVREGEEGVRRGGTPLYMPPEQIHARHGPVGPWSDLYALAAAVWELACGAPPFVGEVNEVLRQQVEATLPSFQPRFPVPPAVEPTLTAMLAKVPGARPRSVHEVWAALVPHRTVGLAEQGVGARLPGIGAGLVSLRQWRVVGRHEERRVLLAALDEVRTSNQPGVVLLTGPAGVGRSRLADWLAQTAAENGLAQVAYRPGNVGRTRALAEHGPLVVVLGELDDDGEQMLASLAFSRRPVLGLACGSLADWPELPLVPGFRELPLGAMEPAAFRDLLQTELGLAGPLALRIPPGSTSPPSPTSSPPWPRS
jgi:hypothetical protein